jgi:hypothetical protein
MVAFLFDSTSMGQYREIHSTTKGNLLLLLLIKKIIAEPQVRCMLTEGAETQKKFFVGESFLLFLESFPRL